MVENKKYRYCVGFKNYEVELTWNLFYERVSDNGEFFFYYKDYNIDVCYDWKNGKRLYSIVLDNGDEHKVWTFDTIDEMVSYRFIDNKSLKELWNELEN